MRLAITLLVLGCVYSNFAEELNADIITDFLAGHTDGERVRRSVLSSASASVPSLAKSFAASIGQASQAGAKMSSGFNSAFTDSCLNSGGGSIFPINPIQQFPSNPFWKGAIATRASQVNNRDYVFVLDTSGSIPDDQFQKAKDAIATLIESFCPTSFGKSVTTEGNKQVALVLFDDSTTTEITFDDSHKGLGYLKDKIRSLRRRRGGTATARALQYVKNNILGTGSSRINVPNVSTDVIVITDGRCNQQCSSLGKDADSLRTKDNGANVFALGIANSRACELEIISGKGDGLSYGLGDFKEFDKFAVAVAEIAKENKQKKCA